MVNSEPTRPVVPPPSGSAAPKSRQRLPPQVRVQQILDQALMEFSQRGFEAARMDDIAQRSGLSKGGLYAHFKSKDELFEALLTRSLSPADLKQLDLPVAAPMRQLLTALVEQMYASLTDAQTVATMRLLIGEGARVPQLVKVWSQRVVEPHLALLSQLLGQRAAQRGGQVSVVVREPWLVMAPAMHVLVSHLILGEHHEVDLSHFKRAHVELLCELLAPGEGAQAAPSGAVRTE